MMVFKYVFLSLTGLLFFTSRLLAAQPLQQTAMETVEHIQHLSPAELMTTTVPAAKPSLNVFPVRSALLTPGKAAARSASSVFFGQPIFLVGSDGLSHAWLKQHAERLKQMGALGLVVQAENSDDVQALQQLVPELTLVPLSGDSFAAAWHITHYPVLLSAQGIES